MHLEGVPKIRIESEIQLRQPYCHAAVDADEDSHHGRWSIDGRCQLIMYYSYVRYQK